MRVPSAHGGPCSLGNFYRENVVRSEHIRRKYYILMVWTEMNIWFIGIVLVGKIDQSLGFYNTISELTIYG